MTHETIYISLIRASDTEPVPRKDGTVLSNVHQLALPRELPCDRLSADTVNNRRLMPTPWSPVPMRKKTGGQLGK